MPTATKSQSKSTKSRSKAKAPSAEDQARIAALNDSSRGAGKKVGDAIAEEKDKKAKEGKARPDLRDVFAIAIDALENKVTTPIHNKRLKEEELGGLTSQEIQRAYMQLLRNSETEDGQTDQYGHEAVVIKIGNAATFDLRSVNPDGKPFRPGSPEEKKAAEEEAAKKQKAAAAKDEPKAEKPAKKEAKAKASKPRKQEPQVGTDGQPATTTPTRQKEEALAEAAA